MRITAVATTFTAGLAPQTGITRRHFTAFGLPVRLQPFIREYLQAHKR
jgi:hypothetical protein